jgi:2-hydroxy-3-oxopropionate reductase
MTWLLQRCSNFAIPQQIGVNLMSLRNQTVAVVGLGIMGMPIAQNLARAGCEVQGWNRSPEPRDEAAKFGITPIANPGDINAAIVLVLLPDLPQLRSVLDAGLRTALKSGDILVVMSTVSPTELVALGKELSNDEVNLMDAPMSGGVEGAQEATLSLMIGGSSEDFALVLPTFKKIGQTIKLMGDLGAGQIAKACNQIIVATTLTAVSEAVALAKRSGLNLDALFDILAGGYASSRILDVKRQKLISEDYSPNGTCKNQLKDCNIILETAEATGTELPVSVVVQKLFAAMNEAGHGALDHSAIIMEIEKRSKSNFEK